MVAVRTIIITNFISLCPLYSEGLLQRIRAMAAPLDLKKIRQDIVFSETLKGQHLNFHTTWGTFSPREIDAGTVMLLDYMEFRETDDCLDLGCGYGPIGMTMARLAPQGRTLMVDRDFIAVEYANANIARNGITNAEAQLSNGFNHR